RGQDARTTVHHFYLDRLLGKYSEVVCASRSRGQDARTTVHHFYLDRVLGKYSEVCTKLSLKGLFTSYVGIIGYSNPRSLRTGLVKSPSRLGLRMSNS
ncbi:MAG: hypothetical protein ACIWVG_00755, partial [Gloeotrichia echinulata HAB0833]